MPDLEAGGRVIGETVGEAVESIEPLGGGTLSSSWRVRLESGRTLFLKTGTHSGAAELEAEAASLRWLAEALGSAEASAAPGALGVAEVAGIGADPEPWLALEWIEPGRLSRGGAEELGRGLAALHRAGAPRHGAMPPGSPDSTLRIGPLHLPLDDARPDRPPLDGLRPDRPPPEDAPASWPELYAERLIEPLLATARDRGEIDASGAATIARVCDRIDDLAGPEEPPSRLHGDLWSGNVYAAADGRPWLIDPIAYGGHREIDLAMLDLFGSPGDRYLAAYEEEYPLPAGHRDRTALWQLFPLLVHTVLFGGSYAARALRIASRYSN